VTDPMRNPALLPPGAVGPATSPARTSGAPRPSRTDGPAFADVLRRAAGGIQLSKHALQRVERRGIDLGPATLARLEDGVARAAAQGAREAVVLVDDTAFVVSVRNRTVVTAVDAEHMREHVFTNIDSAVIA
jgi:flagellar operon protein